MLNGTNMYKHYKEMQYNIGFVPQMDLMRGSDSVFRTLMDAASLRLPKDFTGAERKARVEDVMKIFGLTPVENHMVAKLSGGQAPSGFPLPWNSSPTRLCLSWMSRTPAWTV